MPSHEKLDTIARWLIVTLLGLVPFFFLPISWVTVSQSKMLFASLVLFATFVLWVIARVKEGRLRVPHLFLFASALALALMYALSTAFSGFGVASLVGSGAESDTLAFVALEFIALALAAALCYHAPVWRLPDRCRPLSVPD